MWAQVVPGSLACLRATLMDEVGHLTSAVLTEQDSHLEIQDPAIAMVADRDDCEVSGGDTSPPFRQYGLIGVAPGTTRATLTYEQDGVLLRAVISVEVLPYTFEVEPRIPPQIPAGIVERITGTVRAVDGDMPVRWRVDTGPRIPASLMEFEFSNPLIAEIYRSPEQFDNGWKYLLRGLVPGRTFLSFRVGHPGSQVDFAPVEIHVTDEGSLREIDRFEYEAIEDATSPTGYCYKAKLRGVFARPDAPTYTSIITQGITWTILGDGLVIQDPGTQETICPTRSGESEIRGCVDTLCITGAIPHFKSGELLGIIINSDEVQGRAEPFDGYAQRVCLPLHVEAILTGERRLDMTMSRLMHYGTEMLWYSYDYALSAMYDVDGQILVDHQNRLCFELLSYAVCPPDSSIDLPMEVRFNASVPGNVRQILDSFTVSIIGIAGPEGACR